MKKRQSREGDMHTGYMSPKKLLQQERGHVPKVHVPRPTLTVHLICNAHLDPVWQWRWEEGASEALATFRTAVGLLDEHPALIFCHNESVLYQWVERLDRALFDDIRRLVGAGRWAVSGGWFIQPDVNLPGTESLVRTIAEGRRYFREAFGVAPRVAYNFDSFGHSGGLPQLLRQAGYEMYVHMRPQAEELGLPADLYRWRGVDGTTIPAYRIAVGLYHTEHDNVEEKLEAGVELALKLGRDVPVFWGLGNHGGGATRRDLRTIDDFIARERRVRVVHSTPDRFFDSVRAAAALAPVFAGDLQRCFTGCYTSLSRVKRRAVTSLGGLVQAEAMVAASRWLAGADVPDTELREAWKIHNFNDFHDILSGSCVEPAERDALDQYGRAGDIARSVALRAAAALNRGSADCPALPLTLFNANASVRRAPVEFECMADYRPFWKGQWGLRLFRADGREVPCQEERAEALLPFNDWRRKICFFDELPAVGVKRYYLKAYEIKEKDQKKERGHVPKVRVPAPILASSLKLPSPLPSVFDARSGFVKSLKTPTGAAVECLAGRLLEPLVLEDTADSWGAGQTRYRLVRGRFWLDGRPAVVVSGPLRTVTRSVFVYRNSRLVMDILSYPRWPVLEFRFRLTWNEERSRLKLRVPTALDATGVLCEIPGGAIIRPADGEEHVHGRWLVVEGKSGRSRAALGLASSGQHGLDFRGGELRLSVLRSSAYCHERGFDLDAAAPTIGVRKGTCTSGTCPPSWKFADIGVHDFRVLVTAGAPAEVKSMMPGLADHLAAPPAAYAHLPYDASRCPPVESLLKLRPSSLRLLACKRSWDGQALVVRLHEPRGKGTEAVMEIAPPKNKERGHVPGVHVPGGFPAHIAGAGGIQIRLTFKPFEIKTVRVEPDGTWQEVGWVDEHSA